MRRSRFLKATVLRRTHWDGIIRDNDVWRTMPRLEPGRSPAWIAALTQTGTALPGRLQTEPETNWH